MKILPVDIQNEIKNIYIVRSYIITKNWSLDNVHKKYYCGKFENPCHLFCLGAPHYPDLHESWSTTYWKIKHKSYTGWRFPHLQIKEGKPMLRRVYIIYKNKCTCPDYVYRRKKEGLLCKHLFKKRREDLIKKIFGQFSEFVLETVSDYI